MCRSVTPIAIANITAAPNRSAEIEQQYPVAEQRCVRIAQRRQIADSQQNANLRGPEDSLRQLKAESV